MNRRGALEGGVLCVAASEEADALRTRLAEGGFDLRHWNNGTPS
ncbi:MAG: hypothetical protein ABI649_06805 [Gaiellaceae bacterium]